MNRLLFHITIIMVALTGCVRSMDERLMRVNELAERNEADSATILLQGIAVDSMNEYNRNFHGLMTIKTRDKAYLDVKNDTVIDEIINYFEDKGTDEVKAEAYYYGGRVYREAGDAPQALDYFQKALDALGDDCTHLRRKGIISSQMGQLFMSLCMYEQAKPKFISSIGYFKSSADTVNMICDIRELGEIYRSLGKNDSAMACYNKALGIVGSFEPGGRRELEIRDYICDYYIKKGAFDKAIKEYRTMEALYKGDTMPDYMLTTGINICIIEKNYDKLEKFAHQLLQSSSIYSKKYAYETLANLARFKGEKDKAYDYVMKFRECFNSIDDSASREAVIHQNSFYNYSLREKENLSLKAKQQQLINTICFIVVALLFSVICVVAYFNKNRNLKLELALLLSRLDEMQSKPSPKSAINVDDMTVGQLLDEYNKAFKLLTKDVNPGAYRIHDEIATSPIYRKFCDAIKDKSVKIADDDWASLSFTVNDAHADFKLKLYRLNTKISEHEFQVCLLIKCGFPNKDISKLTNKVPSSITHTKERLYKKLFKADGDPMDLERFVLSL